MDIKAQASFSHIFGNGTQWQFKTPKPTKSVKFKENHWKTQEMLLIWEYLQHRQDQSCFLQRMTLYFKAASFRAICSMYMYKRLWFNSFGMNYMIDNRKMTERVSEFLALVLQGCVKTLKAQSINFLGFSIYWRNPQSIVHAEVQVSVSI